MANLPYLPKMANITTFVDDLPSLPSYTLSPTKDLFSFIPDLYLALLLLPAAYWITSLIFHFIDVYDLFPQYRLHTPAEISARNRASRYEVARDVILQQVVQLIVQYLLNLSEPIEMSGKEDYDVALWARRIRIAQRALPSLLGFVGLNAIQISKNMSGNHPMIAAVLAGGRYPSLTSIQNTTELDLGSAVSVPAFAAWELNVARLIYWILVPAFQFWVAAVFLDGWQYFMHRGMHVNKWMYNKWHSRHHRLYVPYAYGALYNHPMEGFLMDTLGGAFCYKAAFMTPRQGMWLFTLSTIKTVDDHCGYKLPWDPFQHITGNNAAYHDIHHQSWGIKHNFSQPFFTFWDRVLSTVWNGSEEEKQMKYERGRKAAEFLVEAEKVKVPVTTEVNT